MYGMRGETVLSGVVNRPVGSKMISIPKDIADIQQALDTAQSGDCLFLASGEYTIFEPLLIDKDVHLLGADDGMLGGVTITFDRAGSRLVTPDVNLLTITAPSARVSNITFVHIDTRYAVFPDENPDEPQLGKDGQPKKTAPKANVLIFCLLLKEGNILIDNCRFKSSFGSCVCVGPHCHPTLRDCSFVCAPEYGVFVLSDAFVRYQHNAATKCHTAIYFDEASEGIVEDSHIENCEYAVEIVARAHPTIRRNIISQIRSVGLFFSSGVETTDQATIFANHVAQCATGLLSENGAKPSVEKNTFTENLKCAIEVRATGSGQFQLNEIFGNTTGVLICDTGIAEVIKNSIHNNAGEGVSVMGVNTLALIRENDIFENDVGVRATAYAVPSILHNQVCRNQSVGIEVAGCGNARIRGNTVMHNSLDGVRVTDALGQVFDNLIQYNGATGLLIRNAHHHPPGYIPPPPEGFTADERRNLNVDPDEVLEEDLRGGMDEGLSGWYKLPMKKGLVALNVVADNIKTGVDLVASTCIRVVQNTICRNGQGGVMLSNGSSAWMINNDCRENEVSGDVYVSDEASKLLNPQKPAPIAATPVAPTRPDTLE